MFPDSFQTTRLLLRPIAPADAGAVFHGYAQDPEVSRYLTFRPHVRIEDAQAYIARMLATPSVRTYAVINRGTGQLIGTMDLRQMAEWRLGFGYVLAREFWGLGLMTEALTDVTNWALRQPTIFRIGDVCDVDNLASARVMEKSGYVREGLLKRWGLHPNLGDEPRDCFSYAKVR